MIAREPSSAAPVDERVFAIAKQLGELSRNGLMYSTTDYDRQRYEAFATMSAELMGLVGPISGDLIDVEFRTDFGYATPKIDVRAAVFDDAERVLLVQEGVDGRWTLPGGWADPGDTAGAAVARELFEEAGLEATVKRLVGCWDRDRQGNTPRLPVSVYKLFFLCSAVGNPRPDLVETLAVGWFDVDALPPLSITRVTEAQIRRCLAHHRDPRLPTEFD